MKLLQGVKYQLHDFKIVGIIIVGIYLLNLAENILAALFARPLGGSIMISNSIDVYVLALMLIAACLYYKRDFNFCLQSSVSRKTLYFSKIIVSVIMSAIFMLVNLVFTFLSNILCRLLVQTPNFNIENRPMFTDLYYYRDFETFYFFGSDSNYKKIILGCLLTFIVSIAVYMIGTFIASIYYRVNVVAKILIIAIPLIILLVIFPFFNIIVFQGDLSTNGLEPLKNILGFSDKAIWKGMLWCAGVGAAFTIALWISMRKAAIRK